MHIILENRVSEHPSESCSVLDESENIVFPDSNSPYSSNGSQFSDKENSNKLSNKSADNKTPNILKSSKSKIGNSVGRNIRVAPSFKGMS